MPSFSDKSLSRLGTCDPRPQRVFHEVIGHFDCTTLEGHRNQERQNRMVEEGKSKIRWPDGKHNTVPSSAVDATPWPVVWDDRERQTLFAGYVLATATAMGVDLRWGGDWDSDTEVRDNGFDDLVHFEIVEQEARKGVANIIDQFVETDDEKRAAEVIKAKLMMKPSLAQIELNKIEAGHRSIFVAGWRPFIGWVCGFALLWHFILFDLLTWVTVNYFPHVTALPELTGTQTLVTVLLSLLGLGAMRTAEKVAGRTK